MEKKKIGLATSVFSPQAVVCSAKSLRSWISSNKSRSHSSTKPSNGQRYCLVSKTLGQDLSPGRWKTVWSGEDVKPVTLFEFMMMASLEVRFLLYLQELLAGFSREAGGSWSSRPAWSLQCFRTTQRYSVLKIKSWEILGTEVLLYYFS